MASFSKLSVWPVGYFRAFSSWLLRERRDVAARIHTLNAEVSRIGFIKVYYRAVSLPDGRQTMTEERVGFSVTKNSSLERLVQAYIANGGNPLDISPFMMPDQTEVISVSEDGAPVLGFAYPHGGVVAPKSANYNSPTDDPEDTGYGGYKGGFVDFGRYYANRQGARVAQTDLAVAKTMHAIRGWANQSVKTKLQDLEWRIIKLMDLREQLLLERDEVLVQAFGGSLFGLDDFDEDKFSPQLRVQSLIADMNQVIFSTDPSGAVQGYSANANAGFHSFTFLDEPSEIRDPLGG